MIRDMSFTGNRDGLVRNGKDVWVCGGACF